MKAFKLTMMAAMFAFASAAMAQKLDVLKVDPITVANGEEAELVINMDYDNDAETVVGLNFSLYLPDGILLKGFDTKEAQDAAKASALKKACDLGDDGIWGEDADAGWLSVKQKADGGLLFVLIDQDDKTPFETTKAAAVTVKIHAVADVAATGTINTIGMSNDNNISIERGNINDVTFAINGTDGINDIKSSDATAPAYNLQGIRVNNAKGLIIRDGKKMVVK